jgi:hypothetical protein
LDKDTIKGKIIEQRARKQRNKRFKTL